MNETALSSQAFLRSGDCFFIDYNNILSRHKSVGALLIVLLNCHFPC